MVLKQLFGKKLFQNNFSPRIIQNSEPVGNTRNIKILVLLLGYLTNFRSKRIKTFSMLRLDLISCDLMLLIPKENTMFWSDTHVIGSIYSLSGVFLLFSGILFSHITSTSTKLDTLGITVSDYACGI